MRIKTIRQAPRLSGKKVLVRCDFNVPIENGRILDDYKLSQTLLTINYLIQKKAKIILLTHLGRIESEQDKRNFITQPIAARLSKMLKKEVKYLNDCVGLRAGTAVGNLQEQEILLLENIRFESGETKNSRRLARDLAKLADLFVFEAFGAAHRQQASVTAIQDFLPSYAGFLLADEINNLDKALKPAHPLVLVLGGVKLSTKLPLLAKFIKKADKILVGGGLANNFLAAAGLEIGRSVADPESISLARRLKRDNILVPIDVIVGRKNRDWQKRLCGIRQVTAEDYIFDIGPKTISLYSGLIKEARTILWNGPMGMFEDSDYKHGTLAIARTIAARSKGRAFGIAGGGETVAALRETKMMAYVDWVSTGGGAMLSYLAGQDMPGLKKLIG